MMIVLVVVLLVFLVGHVDQSGGNPVYTCSYEWVVHGTIDLVNDKRGPEVTMEEIVQRSFSKDGLGMYDSQIARMRLTWVVGKSVGPKGQVLVDLRATSKAKGLGIRPDVRIYSFFWGDHGSASGTLRDSWGVDFDDSGDGWVLSLNMSDATFGPLLLQTTSGWESSLGAMDICSSTAVLRTPLIEMADLDEATPFIGVGSHDKKLFTESNIHNEHSEQDKDLEAWNFYGRAGYWDRLQVNFVYGVSWLWFALVDHGGRGAGLAVWASSNSFSQVKESSIMALDLSYVYPFTNPRSEVDYEWDIVWDPDIYEGMEEVDDYEDHHVDTNSSWFNGPCQRNGTWTPQLFSYGKYLVASTSWGLAYRSIENATLKAPYVNYGWKSFAPMCAKMIPRTQINPVDVAWSCSFFFYPFSENVTVPFTNETSFDAAQFQDVETPTVFLTKIQSPECRSVHERLFHDQQQDLNPTTVSDSGRSSSGEEDTIFVVEEMVDMFGQPLWKALNLSSDSKILDITTSLPDGDKHVLVLIETMGSMYDLVSLSEGKWKTEFSFPRNGFSPMTFLHDSVGKRFLSDSLSTESFSTLVQLRAMKSSIQVSKHVYVYGNVLLMSPNGGKTFWQVAQSEMDSLPLYNVDESERLAVSFHNDVIVDMTTSNDGWVAVLTNSSNIWIGRTGGDRVFLLKENVRQEFGSVSPLALVFNEDQELLVIGFGQRGQAMNMETLQGALKVNYNMFRMALTKPNQDCKVMDTMVFAQHQTDFTRELKKEDGFSWSDLVQRQNLSFYNALPERIFLDAGETYEFKVRLYVNSSANMEEDPTYSEVNLGLEMSNQDLLGVHVTKMVDIIERTVEYGFSIRDIYAWRPSMSGNEVDTPEEDSLDLLLDFKEPEENGTKITMRRLPGQDLSVTTLRIKGMSEDCVSTLDPNSLMSTRTTDGPLTLQIYSGCPPLRLVKFDRGLTRILNPESGCTEDKEDICLFYLHIFEPRFKLIDLVTEEERVVGGSFGNFTVIGGGLTYDTIQDFPEDTRDSISSQVLTFENADNLRWVCLVKGSPCYNIQPNFPEPPQYYFKVQFNAKSEDSYCDYSTVFIVRVHNLPITFETILLTNLVTIVICFLPLLYLYRKHQANQFKNMHIKDVDMKQYQRNVFSEYHSSSDESSRDGSDDSEDESSFTSQ